MGKRMSTTQWSLVIRARDGSETEARQAMEQLCTIYWPPLYAFIRHDGWGPEDARDLAQAYFVELLEKNLLAEVDAEKGRFRSFLFSTLRNFVSHQRDRERALKRGGGAQTIPLDLAVGEEAYALEASSRMTPEDVFEHRWAMTVLSRAMERLRHQSDASGNGRQFALLKAHLTSGDSDGRQSYREIAEELGMNEGAVKVAVHRLRKQFGRCLRAELSDTVVDPEDVDDELRHLLAVVRE